MNERIYMHDDDVLGVKGETDQSVRLRHLARYNSAISMADKPGGLWMDCACGSGYGAAMIAEHARYVYAIDRDAQTVRYAFRHHWRPNVSYLCAELRDVTYFTATAGGFDAIVSIETLEHVSLLEQRSWIRMAAGLLLGDGCMVVCCPVGDGKSDNPWHSHEPSELELAGMLGDWFNEYDIHTEPYESTSGPAVQAYCVARYPRQVPRAA